MIATRHLPLQRQVPDQAPSKPETPEQRIVGRRVACAAGLIWRQDRLGGLPLLGSRTRFPFWQRPQRLLQNLQLIHALEHA